MKEPIVEENKEKVARVIHLSGDVNLDMYDLAAGQLIDFEEESDLPITVYLNSYGGDVRQAIAIYDLLSTSNCDIIGVVVGACYSAAPIILQGCDTRLATPNACFMLHYGTFSSGEVHGTEVEAVFNLDKTENALADSLSLINTHKRKLVKLMKKGTYFYADTARDLGLIDDIIAYRK